MAELWEWQPKDRYARVQALRFRREAQGLASRYLVGPVSVSSAFPRQPFATVDPDEPPPAPFGGVQRGELERAVRPQRLRDVVQNEKKSGGLWGKLRHAAASAAGEVGGAIGAGLGGVLGALEWEEEHIGKPVVRGIYGAEAAFAAPFRGRSPVSEFRRAWESYEERLPPWEKGLLQSILVPSSFLPVGGLAKIGGRVATRTLAKLFGRQAAREAAELGAEAAARTAGKAMEAAAAKAASVPAEEGARRLVRIPLVGLFRGPPAARGYASALAEGVPEERALRMAAGAKPRRVPKLGGPLRPEELQAELEPERFEKTFLSVRSVDEVMAEQKLLPSYNLSQLVDRVPVLRRLAERMGLDVYKQPWVGPIVEREHFLASGESKASYIVDTFVRRPLRKAFRFDETGKYVLGLDEEKALRAGLNPRPGLDELGQKLSDYLAAGVVTPEQAAAVRIAGEPLHLMRQMVEQVTGKKLAKFPGEVYFHREALSKKIVTSRGEELPVGFAHGLSFDELPGFFRPRELQPLEEMERRGVRYMDMFSAQEEYIRQAYHIVADRWFKDAVAPFGRTAGELMPEQLREAATRSAAKVRWAKALREQALAGSRGRPVRLPTGPKFAPEAPEELRPYVDRLREVLQRTGPAYRKGLREELQKQARAKLAEVQKLPRGQRGQARKALQEELAKARAEITERFGPEARRQELRGLARELGEVVTSARQEQRAVQAQVARWSRGITRGAHGGTPEFSDYISKLGRYFPADIARRLRMEVEPRRVGGPLRAVVTLNDIFRKSMSSVLDASFYGVHGLFGAFAYPEKFARTLVHGFGLGYDEYLRSAARRGTLQRFFAAGGRLDSETYGPTEWTIGGALGRFPLFQLTNRLFIRARNSFRLQIFEAGLSAVKSQAEERQLARLAELMTFFVPGRTTTLEQAASYAPRFFRAQLTMLAEAATARGLAGKTLRRKLFQYFGLATGLTYLLNAVRGYETDFEPGSANFMRVRNVFGTDLALLGPWDTLLRATFSVAKGEPAAAAKYLARVKASPSLNMLWSAIERDTFTGQKLDFGSYTETARSMAVLLSGALPISLQEHVVQPALAEVGLGAPGERPLRERLASPAEYAGSLGIAMTGVKATALTPWERRQLRRDDLATREYGRPWDDLEPFEQAALGQRFPEVVEEVPATTERARAYAERRRIFEDYNRSLERLEEEVRSGARRDPARTPEQVWREGMEALRKEKDVLLAQWEEAHPDLVLSPEEAERRYRDDPEKLAFFQYTHAFRVARDPLTGELDQRKLDRELARWEEEWRKRGRLAEVKAYIDRNLGIHDTPMTAAYRRAQERLRPYWDVPERIWQERMNPETLARFPTFDDYLTALRADLAARGYGPAEVADLVQEDPLVKWMNARTRKERERTRILHPDIDELLARWYGTEPLALRESRRRRRRRRLVRAVSVQPVSVRSAFAGES